MLNEEQDIDFDIVIPVYQNYEGIIACLNSLAELSGGEVTFRAIVCVDGAEEDDTYGRLQQLSLSYQILILSHPDKKRHGRNATRNLSLPHICAKYVLTLDSDMQAGKKLLSEHWCCLNQNFPCLSLGGVTYLDAEQNYWADYLNYRGKAKYQAGSELPFYYLAMGNAAFPAQTWLKLGGQDANMTHYGGGDTEFAYRIHQQFAWKTFYNPDAEAIALSEKKITTAIQQYYEFGKINLHYIRQKHPGFTQLFRFDLWGNNSLRAIVIRSFLCLNWRAWLQPLVAHLPSRIRRLTIHWIISSQVVRGFQAGRPIKSNS